MADPVAYVVTEFARDQVPTGLARRSDHLIDHLRAHGVPAERLALSDARRSRTGVVARLRTARKAPALLGAVPLDRTLVLVGLGTPTMLVAARRLARAGRPIVFDHCDSVLLQLRERLIRRDPRLVLIALWLLVLHLASSSRMAFCYISGRDAGADRMLLRGREAVLAGPTAPPSISGLPPFEPPVRRLVVPVELASTHALQGYEMLLEAMRVRRGVLPVELFGPTPPTGPLPDGMRYAGFAAGLQDLYEGRTAVLVTNIGGSGVPNKLVEAASAHRPLIVHPSMLGRWPLDGPVHLFTNAAELARAIDAVERGETGSAHERAVSQPVNLPTLARLIGNRAGGRGRHDDD